MKLSKKGKKFLLYGLLVCFFLFLSLFAAACAPKTLAGKAGAMGLAACYDTDGNDIFERGKTLAKDSGGNIVEYEDVCRELGGVQAVVEYACDGKEAVAKVTKCLEGQTCVEGECT